MLQVETAQEEEEEALVSTVTGEGGSPTTRDSAFHDTSDLALQEVKGQDNVGLESGSGQGAETRFGPDNVGPDSGPDREEGSENRSEGLESGSGQDKGDLTGRDNEGLETRSGQEPTAVWAGDSSWPVWNRRQGDSGPSPEHKPIPLSIKPGDPNPSLSAFRPAWSTSRPQYVHLTCAAGTPQPEDRLTAKADPGEVLGEEKRLLGPRATAVGDRGPSPESKPIPPNTGSGDPNPSLSVYRPVMSASRPQYVHLTCAAGTPHPEDHVTVEGGSGEVLGEEERLLGPRATDVGDRGPSPESKLIPLSIKPGDPSPSLSAFRPAWSTSRPQYVHLTCAAGTPQLEDHLTAKADPGEVLGEEERLMRSGSVPGTTAVGDSGRSAESKLVSPYTKPGDPDPSLSAFRSVWSASHPQYVHLTSVCAAGPPRPTVGGDPGEVLGEEERLLGSGSATAVGEPRDKFPDPLHLSQPAMPDSQSTGSSSLSQPLDDMCAVEVGTEGVESGEGGGPPGGDNTGTVESSPVQIPDTSFEMDSGIGAECVDRVFESLTNTAFAETPILKGEVCIPSNPKDLTDGCKERPSVPRKHFNGYVQSVHFHCAHVSSTDQTSPTFSESNIGPYITM